MTLVAEDGLEAWLARQPAELRRWVRAADFAAGAGEVCLVPDGRGGLARVVAGMGRARGGAGAMGADGRAADESLWACAGLPGALPPGTYRLAPEAEPGAAPAPGRVALGWALGSYAFTRYRKRERKAAKLVWPQGADQAEVARTARAVGLVRDLINTPAADMGPAELAAAARSLAASHKARVEVIAGDALLRRDYPTIHAVGRAAGAGRCRGRDRAPRLIDLSWGRKGAPRVTLVGKGVCFDTGGLNLKPDSAMKLMKKDMGGAAHVLGLASMIMDAGLDLRLRVLIPAVENSVSGAAMRPLDVIRTRKGLTVEVGHTDAEGRLILCDALAEAARERPALLMDFATLTGAARAALGPDVPALFANDDALARDLMDHGAREGDPVWRLPLWRGYREQLKSTVADLSNIASGPHGGAITAALFLSEFVDEGVPWAHLDLMAWNLKSRPGRPEGGEAQGLRAAFAAIAARFAPAGRGGKPRRRTQKPR